MVKRKYNSLSEAKSALLYRCLVAGHSVFVVANVDGQEHDVSAEMHHDSLVVVPLYKVPDIDCLSLFWSAYTTVIFPDMSIEISGSDSILAILPDIFWGIRGCITVLA